MTRHAYGLDTSFEVQVGSGGRLVNFNAEYDALPDIGHACGHNLIATASLTAFLATASLLERTKLPGRAQLLGTPAEEHGGGKLDLLKAGAYDGVDASLMSWVLHRACSDLLIRNKANSMSGTQCHNITMRTSMGVTAPQGYA